MICDFSSVSYFLLVRLVISKAGIGFDSCRPILVRPANSNQKTDPMNKCRAGVYFEPASLTLSTAIAIFS